MNKKFLPPEKQELIMSNIRKIFANLDFRRQTSAQISEKFGASRQTLQRYADDGDVSMSVFLRTISALDIDIADVFAIERATTDVCGGSSQILMQTIDNLNKVIAEKERQIQELKRALEESSTACARTADLAQNRPQN